MDTAITKKKLSGTETEELLSMLENRFRMNMNRHKGLVWDDIRSKLDSRPEMVRALSEMERTGGEPDVIGRDKKTGKYIFCDCSPESPKGRRNTCYDREGQEAREKQDIHPAGNAVDMAEAIGIELLSEEQYRELQKVENFDLKTSSWVKTPPEIRNLGGALFADRRYDHVFIYHNSAPSFYSSRGFRGLLRI